MTADDDKSVAQILGEMQAERRGTPYDALRRVPVSEATAADHFAARRGEAELITDEQAAAERAANDKED